MHVAAELNMLQVMDKFIDLGGDMTAVNNRGFTCLHLACRDGHTDMVKLLLARGKYSLIYEFHNPLGCDENTRDKFGYTASYWAHKEKFNEIEELLPAPMKRT